jgi:hypothetical protein
MLVGTRLELRVPVRCGGLCHHVTASLKAEGFAL